MATDTKMQDAFYDRAQPERDYGGGAGYARKQPAIAGDASARAAEVRQHRRQWMAVLPAGRALDEEHLRSLVDEGNQTAPACQMRRRLLAYAVAQLKDQVILSGVELATMERWDAEESRSSTERAPIPSWPPSS